MACYDDSLFNNTILSDWIIDTKQVFRVINESSEGSVLVQIEYHQVMFSILTKLYNLCIKFGFYPNQCEESFLVPIFKKVDRLNVKNYRPVSLITPISKMFDSSSIAKPLRRHLEK